MKENKIEVKEKLLIEYLYLDLSCCERCQGGYENLKSAVQALALPLSDYDVAIKHVYIDTEQKAIAHKFLSSPTIRINGTDILGEVKENNCAS